MAQALAFSELQILSRENGLQMAYVVVPFHLNLFHWAERLFKSVKAPAAMQQFKSVLATAWTFEEEMRQGPPVQRIQVEMAV